MANQYVNKVVYGNQTIIDLTDSTVTTENLLSGVKAYNASGAQITGECTYDADTSDATVNASEMLEGKTAYKGGSKVTGTMVNRGGVTGSITTKDQEYTIQSGYHDGSGSVSIASAEQAKIIASNIKSGVQILGVTGTYEGEAGRGQAKSATPYTNKSSTILPDEDYDYLTQVTVAQIAYVETDNVQGGKTVTIGTVG